VSSTSAQEIISAVLGGADDDVVIIESIECLLDQAGWKRRAIATKDGNLGEPICQTMNEALLKGGAQARLALAQHLHVPST
jgi:hypothetical protein